MNCLMLILNVKPGGISGFQDKEAKARVADVVAAEVEGATVVVAVVASVELASVALLVIF